MGAEGWLVYVFMLSPPWNVQSHCEKLVNAAPKGAPGSDETPGPVWHVSR